MIDQRERMAREGMYRPEFEGDACGVGLVAAEGAVHRVRMPANLEELGI